jgi:crotonobetainyl-CoA:carnitine CoA-transferase CaiB-like acyl-CoA transferase
MPSRGASASIWPWVAFAGKVRTGHLGHVAIVEQRQAGRCTTALATQSVAFWNDSLSAVGVPCSPINTLQQLLDHPHTRASGIILDYEHPLAGPTQAVGQPFLLDGAPRETGLPPPLHGQHTDHDPRVPG